MEETVDEEKHGISSGEFRTQTPGGWGAGAHGDNPGAYRDAHFKGAFPEGLTIGCQEGYTAKFSCAAAIEAFLPAGSTPGSLVEDMMDPTATPAGVLAGHVVALTLSIGFDSYDADFGSSDIALGDLVAAGGACEGLTVTEILYAANALLGGCESDLAFNSAVECVTAINENFVDGKQSGGYLALP